MSNSVINFNANFFDFYESTDSKLTRTTYECFNGTCDFNCVRTYEDRVPIDGSPCEYYEVSKVSFLDGETKVHDDITIEEKKVEHTYEVLEMQPLEGEILDEDGYRDEDLGRFHGSVKCKKCGAIRKNKAAKDDDVDLIIKLSAKH